MNNCVISIFTTLTILYVVCLVSKYKVYSDPVIRHKSQELLEQSFKWYNQVNKNTIASLRNCIYASAYLNSARLLANDSELSQMTGIDIQKLWKEIEDKEFTLTKKIAKEMKLRKTSVSNPASWK